MVDSNYPALTALIAIKQYALKDGLVMYQRFAQLADEGLDAAQRHAAERECIQTIAVALAKKRAKIVTPWTADVAVEDACRVLDVEPRAPHLRGVFPENLIDYTADLPYRAFVAGVRDAFKALDPDRDDDGDVISAADFVEIVGQLLRQI